MQVAKWGNSLAIRIPASVAKVLDLREGDDVEVVVAGSGSFEVERTPDLAALLERLDKFRGRLPADWKFDRLEANARGRDAGD